MSAVCWEMARAGKQGCPGLRFRFPEDYWGEEFPKTLNAQKRGGVSHNSEHLVQPSRF